MPDHLKNSYELFAQAFLNKSFFNGWDNNPNAYDLCKQCWIESMNLTSPNLKENGILLMLKSMSESIKGFDFRISYNPGNGQMTGFVWQTLEMRTNLYHYGKHLCMDFMHHEINNWTRKTLQVIRFIPNEILTLRDKKNEEHWPNWDRLSYKDVDINFYSKLFRSNKRFHGNKEAVELCTVLATEMAYNMHTTEPKWTVELSMKWKPDSGDIRYFCSRRRAVDI